jgi:2'-5' RNA ligase
VSRPNWFVALRVAAPELPRALGVVPAGVRAFHADDLHATIAFLGPVSEEAARTGWDALSIALAPRAVALGEVVPLGDERHPSALSALVHDDAVTAAIASSRDAVWRAAGAHADDRPALAHVTVARIDRRASDRERASAIAWAKRLDLRNVPARIDEVALYGWSDDRRERLFRVVAARRLA